MKNAPSAVEPSPSLSLVHRFQALKDREVMELPEDDAMAQGFHRWSQRELDALTLALSSRRPLLVRGEPGTGKTQLARAAAVHLGWRLESVTVHARFEATDLLYRFDAVKRLADAQAQKPLEEASYWEPGPLWRAFDWAKASGYGSARSERAAPAGHVVLIDEIDKADADLPNSLLEILGQRCFRLSALGLTVGGRPVVESSATPRPAPLVIVTTNEERELPAAFLRRCVVLNLDVDDAGDYAAWLVDRGRAHYGAIEAPSPVARSAILGDDVLGQAAAQLVVDRVAVQQAGLSPPGLAEYLDLLEALHALAPGHQDEQIRWLDRLSGYGFVKHGRESGLSRPQQRGATAP
jgi:MoxR-like ATPase